MNFTNEQKEIIQAIKQKKNVRVVSVAGSGKTTTILGLLGCDLNILVFCYNNRLRAETIERASILASDLLEISGGIFDIHTFHSFCHGVLDEPLATTDIGIIKIINKDLSELRKKKIEKYDVIIVDEVQDMTPEYFKLVSILRDLTGASLCLIGDPRQAIYQFNGATEKYLLSPEEHFGDTFESYALSESFRMNNKMASFINGTYLTKSEDTESRDMDDRKNEQDKPKIISSREDGFCPMIIHSSASDRKDQIVSFVSKCNPEDVLILMYSIKRNPNRTSVQIANMLEQKGVPVSFGNIPTGNKKSVLMLSYHQSKGLERKIVILLDLGSSYFRLTNEDPRFMPNLWYVAMTRASQFFIAYLDCPFEFINNGLKEIGKEVQEDVYTQDSEIHCGEREYKSFEDYIKYTPSIVLWEKINNGPEMPKMISIPDVGKIPLKMNGPLISEILSEYLRSRQRDPNVFLKDYKKRFLGGLKCPVPDSGFGNLQYIGYGAMTILDSLNCAKRIFDTFLDLFDIKILQEKKTSLGTRELYHRDNMIIISVDPWSMDTRMRWTMAKPGDFIVDIIGQRYGLY